MYLRYYGLEKKPFDITPDPEFLFLGDSHKEALAAIVYGVENRKGFIVITGEVGLGKTMIVRSYLKQFSSKKLETVLIFNTKVSFQELMISIYDDLELPMKTEDQFQLVLGFQNYLIENYKKGSNLVLIIDEAQHLPVETLENLRMLSNFETAKEKLLQVILIGQPELSNLLELQELRQLKQRIAVRTALAPLTRQESLDYISHRIQKAGGGIDQLFTKGALKRIVAYAEGIPRKIQILCDNALVAGLGYQKKPVTAKIVNEAIGDMERKSVTKPKFPLKAVFAAVLLLFTAGTSFFFFANNFFPGSKPSASPIADSLDSKKTKPSTSPAPPAPSLNHIQPRKSPAFSSTPSKAITRPSKRATRTDSMALENRSSDQPAPEKKTVPPTAATGETSPKTTNAAAKPGTKAAKPVAAKPETSPAKDEVPKTSAEAAEPASAVVAPEAAKPVAAKPETSPAKDEVPKISAEAAATASAVVAPEAARPVAAKPETSPAKDEVPKISAEAAATASAVVAPEAAKPVAVEKKPIDEKKAPEQEEKNKMSSTGSTGEPKVSDEKQSQATSPTVKTEDKKNRAQDVETDSKKGATPRPQPDEPDAMDLMDWVLKNK